MTPISSVSAYGNGLISVTKQRLDLSNSQNDFGLKNQNTSNERLSAIRNIQIDADNTYETINRQESSDANADFGLNDKNTANERLTASRELKQRVISNHGFDAKRAQVNALARNTMIINIPPHERGSLVNHSA